MWKYLGSSRTFLLHVKTRTLPKPQKVELSSCLLRVSAVSSCLPPCLEVQRKPCLPSYSVLRGADLKMLSTRPHPSHIGWESGSLVSTDFDWWLSPAKICKYCGIFDNSVTLIWASVLECLSPLQDLESAGARKRGSCYHCSYTHRKNLSY